MRGRGIKRERETIEENEVLLQRREWGKERVEQKRGKMRGKHLKRTLILHASQRALIIKLLGDRSIRHEERGISTSGIHTQEQC